MEASATGASATVPLVVIATVLVLAGPKWSTPATMPLAFAIFLIALCWPIREFLNRHVSSKLSFVGTTLAPLIVLALFVGAIYFAAQSLASGLPRYNQDLQNLLEQVRSWLQSHGLPAPQDMVRQETLGRLARRVVTGLYTWGGLVLFILALAILGYPPCRSCAAVSSAYGTTARPAARCWRLRGERPETCSASSRPPRSRAQSPVG
jgi:predicted PurR-regulated permease PerM